MELLLYRVTALLSVTGLNLHIILLNYYQSVLFYRDIGAENGFLFV